MKHELSRGRRFAVAAAALVCAVLLFRTQISEALIVRGDDYLYRGDRAAALERYRRALWIAPWLQTGADRYVFVSLELQTPRAIHRALSAANRYLAAYPHDAVLLSDRGLGYLHARRYAEAQHDFAVAANATHSVTDYMFAGFAAEHARHHRAAIELWQAALKAQPGYRPALIAIAEHRR